MSAVAIPLDAFRQVAIGLGRIETMGINRAITSMTEPEVHGMATILLALGFPAVPRAGAFDRGEAARRLEEFMVEVLTPAIERVLGGKTAAAEPKVEIARRHLRALVDDSVFGPVDPCPEETRAAKATWLEARNAALDLLLKEDTDHDTQ
ncbi:MAG: hypothetical protein AAF618_00265 [Pseudomonadota bacterium]